MPLAQKFLAEIYRNNKTDPRRFSIISAAEDVFYHRMPLEITGVSLPVEDMAKAIVQNIFTGLKEKDKPIQNIKLSGKLILRETVNKVK